MINNTSVDSYLADGCGRCDHYRKPSCKVHLWTEPLLALRELVNASELTEEMKWGSPCYTLDGKNVLMLVSTRRFCALSFLRGAALDDPAAILEKPGPNSRYARYARFETVDEVAAAHDTLVALVAQAIAAARSGEKFEPEDAPEPMPAELEERLAVDPELDAAFTALTPGRQRSHILHISGAKQAATRERRVDKCSAKILAGKGFNER